MVASSSAHDHLVVDHTSVGARLTDRVACTVNSQFAILITAPAVASPIISHHQHMILWCCNMLDLHVYSHSRLLNADNDLGWFFNTKSRFYFLKILTCGCWDETFFFAAMFLTPIVLVHPLYHSVQVLINISLRRLFIITAWFLLRICTLILIIAATQVQLTLIRQKVCIFLSRKNLCQSKLATYRL